MSDVETGNASTDQAMAETRPSVSRDSEFERKAQLKEVEKRQSANTASDIGSADVLEATPSKETDRRKSTMTTSDAGVSEVNDRKDDGEKTAELEQSSTKQV